MRQAIQLLKDFYVADERHTGDSACREEAALTSTKCVATALSTNGPSPTGM